MDNDIEDLFLKKQKKDNIYIDNSLFSSFEDCSFRSNTFQSNFNLTKGRVNNKIEFTNHFNSNPNKSEKIVIQKNNSNRLMAIKKCFQIVKDRKELNKTLMEKCKKILNEKNNENNNKEINNKEIFSYTCNSFFKRNVDNFINNYLNNNYCVNDNINSLNDIEKNDNNQKKNITVNKNCSLYNLTKNDNKNNKGDKKINNDDNKKHNNKNNLKSNNKEEKLIITKLDSKKYINVNRVETLRLKNNNYFSKIKNMFNNKKEELIKNNSFCQRHTVNNKIVNSQLNKLFLKESININYKSPLDKSFNKLFSKNNIKNNISLRKRNYQNNNKNNFINLNSDKDMNNYNSLNNEQKVNSKKNYKNNLVDKINSNNSERTKKGKCNSIEYTKNLNQTITSPTLYNSQSGFYFNSPNFVPIKKMSINSPSYEDLSFRYKSLKEKINKIDKDENKYQTLNQENNRKEEILKINQIYTNTNTLNSNYNRKNKIIKIKSNSKDKKLNCKINNKNGILDNFNLNKSPLISNSLNYFSQMSNRNSSVPYIINHMDINANPNTNLNIVSAERKKEKKIKENFFEGINIKVKPDNKNNNNKQNKINTFNKNENKSHTNILNSLRKKDNKNDIIKNKIDKIKYNSNNNKEKNNKPKIKTKQKQINQNDKNKINDFQNKTTYNFFINANNINYDSLKKGPKILTDKYFSELDNSFLEKAQKFDKNLEHIKIKTNQINNNINKTSNTNKIKQKKKINDIKNSNKNKNNNKPFSLCSARQNNNNNYITINTKNNDKTEKLNENRKIKSFINNIDKIINFCGNNKDNFNQSIKNKYYETYNNINYKSKNIKKKENPKLKNYIKETEILKTINISKIKIKQKNKINFIKKFYSYTLQKEIINNCFITKEIKNLDKPDNHNIFLSNQKNKNNNKINIEEINGGIIPSNLNNIYNNNSDIKNNQIKEDFISIYNSNSFNCKENKNNKINVNQKNWTHLKINKNNIKNQLNINSNTIMEYKDLNKRLKFNELNDEISEINYYDEESEVTFGRKEHISLNHKTISNKKTKHLNNFDINNYENIICLNNNNTFCYNNNNELENDNDCNNFMLDEESFVNGEVNCFNNTFNPNNQKIINNKIIYDSENNSISNNYNNSNKISLFNSKKKSLSLKHIEKGTIILANIFLNYKSNIYKYLKNYYILQKCKNKNEFVIYTKKKLKDNGAKNYETTLTVGSKRQLNYPEINNNLTENEEKEKLSFEKKKNNLIKKLQIRTRSTDYIIFDKNDKSFIKKVEIDLNNINNKKVVYTLNPNFNTPKNEDKKVITSPHFINNNKINVQINKEFENLNNDIKVKDNEIKEKKSIEKNLNIKNLKNFHCTPKFCQIKPRTVEDIKFKEHFNNNKKCFSMEEIFYIGSSNSLCFKECLLSNDFLSHCDEMLKYVEIVDKNKLNNNNFINKLFNSEKQNQNKYEIISLLNKITNSNFKIILDKLNYLIINDNNNQYLFIKIIINKIINEKKYINLYAKLCFELYNEIINRANNNKKNNKEFYNQNLGFDNDLKNILINECKLKFNFFINGIKDKEMKNNIKDIKNKIFCFFDFIIELIYLKMIFFENSIYYLEKLFKEYINNNNGNNISFLYLELILYLMDKILRKILNSSTIKNKNNFKKLIEEKFVFIFENSELLQNFLKYKIINIKEKINSFLNNNITNSNINENEIEYNNIYINEIINNIFINNKIEDNIKLLLLNDLDNFIKDKILNNLNHNWFIIDEIIFNIHISLDDFILYYIEITKNIDIKNKIYQYEYFENVLDYYIKYILDDKEKIKKKILDIFLKICSKNENIEKYFGNLGHIIFLMINKNVFSINDFNYFINENIDTKKNIVEIIKNIFIFKKELYEKFKRTKFFINNKDLFSMIENTPIYKQ